MKGFIFCIVLLFFLVKIVSSQNGPETIEDTSTKKPTSSLGMFVGDYVREISLTTMELLEKMKEKLPVKEDLNKIFTVAPVSQTKDSKSLSE